MEQPLEKLKQNVKKMVRKVSFVSTTLFSLFFLNPSLSRYSLTLSLSLSLARFRLPLLSLSQSLATPYPYLSFAWASLSRSHVSFFLLAHVTISCSSMLSRLRIFPLSVSLSPCPSPSLFLCFSLACTPCLSLACTSLSFPCEYLALSLVTSLSPPPPPS